MAHSAHCTDRAGGSLELVSSTESRFRQKLTLAQPQVVASTRCKAQWLCRLKGFTSQSTYALQNQIVHEVIIILEILCHENRISLSLKDKNAAVFLLRCVCAAHVTIGKR